LYYILKFIAILIVLLFTNHKIKGKENVPRRGPLLVVANHLSVSDPVLIGIFIGRRVIFMAKEELFKKFFHRYFVRQFGAFSVSRRRSSRQALTQANEVLAQGQVLGMFPEGKRSYQNQLTLALNGSALIAYHNKAPILPVGITGTEKIRGLGWILHRPEITLNIGRPFTLPDAGTALSREVLLGLTNVLMNKIAELLPPKYRGSYEGVKPKWPL